MALGWEVGVWGGVAVVLRLLFLPEARNKPGAVLPAHTPPLPSLQPRSGIADISVCTGRNYRNCSSKFSDPGFRSTLSRMSVRIFINPPCPLVGRRQSDRHGWPSTDPAPSRPPGCLSGFLLTTRAHLRGAAEDSIRQLIRQGGTRRNTRVSEFCCVLPSLHYSWDRGLPHV